MHHYSEFIIVLITTTHSPRDIHGWNLCTAWCWRSTKAYLGSNWRENMQQEPRLDKLGSEWCRKSEWKSLAYRMKRDPWKHWQQWEQSTDIMNKQRLYSVEENQWAIRDLRFWISSREWKLRRGRDFSTNLLAKDAIHPWRELECLARAKVSTGRLRILPLLGFNVPWIFGSKYANIENRARYIQTIAFYLTKFFGSTAGCIRQIAEKR